jgi:UDP-N-acetylglucosamine diphosphorylase / glucose-1-phosphate thymidylyltransferase / UDP-N-acetylgalactosamine diphosphorylase / glucosamine-1-phosphate N-acetyltransferase / galactosamine-1-phosphate N-acetyltransferase
MIVVLAMAGRGSRFVGSGYITPKPFIKVGAKHMFTLALENIVTLPISKLVIVALAEHALEYDILKSVPELLQHKTIIVSIPEITEGQLCTVLAAEEHICNDESLLIVSSDTIVKSNIEFEIKNLPEYCNGLISVANMPGERWSFALTDLDGKVIEVAEKIKISNHASTGIYFFSSGKEFCNYGNEIINQKQKTKGEYYIIPVYTKYIENNKWIGISIAKEMYDLGTPESLKEYLLSQKI